MQRLVVLLSFFLFCASVQASTPLSHQELTQVNDLIQSHVNQSTLTPLARLLFSSYLAQAQKDFAIELKKQTGSFQGSFVPVSLAIMQLFQPQALIAELEDMPVDMTSQGIAIKIAEQYKARLKIEGSQIKNYPTPPGSIEGLEGLNYGTLLPWYLKKCSDLRCSPPSTDRIFFLKELDAVQRGASSLDKAKLVAIDFWAHQADWEKIAEKHMKAKMTSLETRLDVRAVLLSTLTDATGAAYDAKYTYWIPRPSQFDPQIITVIATPKSPSYPSSHSAVGRAAAVVLSRYFPETQAKWDAMAEEEGESRVWAGVQFPMDHLAGKEIGEKAALKALSTPK